MSLPFSFDFRNPDYREVFQYRLDALKNIRKNQGSIQSIKTHYKNNPADFINDWGCTYDPRNIERGLPAIIPFILFPRQEEWVVWIIEKWRLQSPGLTEKSRDVGMSWLSMALACTMCLHYDSMMFGVGSRKEEYVDRGGDPKSLFHKARQFMSFIPPELSGNWDLKKNSSHMKIMFPGTKSAITGEAGDNIGRGDRASIYFVDEAAYIERPMLVEASLSQTTNCRQDLSSVNGMGNPFAEKRHGGKVPVFTFHWRDDPRKDNAWYEKQCFELSPVVVAQEIDLNYSASVEGVLIPSAWVQAAIDSHIKLGIEITGEKYGALDVADEGVDLNSFAGRTGILLDYLESWSGKGDDIFGTVQRTFNICVDNDIPAFKYDADGLGAGVRGDSRVINDQRHSMGQKKINVEPFRGSGEVSRPEREDVPKRKNKDFFQNFKAQSWWSLRRRFQNTYRAVVEGMEYDKDEIISISSKLAGLSRLMSELSQPTYSINTTGKIVVDKKPDGMKSPNDADAMNILYSPGMTSLSTWAALGRK